MPMVQSNRLYDGWNGIQQLSVAELYILRGYNWCHGSITVLVLYGAHIHIAQASKVALLRAEK